MVEWEDSKHTASRIYVVEVSYQIPGLRRNYAVCFLILTCILKAYLVLRYSNTISVFAGYVYELVIKGLPELIVLELPFNIFLIII